MGFSMGGGSVLAALEKGLVEQLHAEKFRAGVAFYPLCRSASGISTAPALVLIGDADDWTPATACEAMVAGQGELGVSRGPGDRSQIELVIYPGAHHGFDLLDLSLVPSSGITYQGHRIEYNEVATRNSIARVRDFLLKALAVP
jgi:dienelactone hydrolase